MVSARPPMGNSFEPICLPTERELPFNPPNELAELRDSRPLARLRFPDGHVGWLVTGHALAREVLADPRFSRLPSGPPNWPAERQAALVFDAVKNDSSFPKDVLALMGDHMKDGRFSGVFRDSVVLGALHGRAIDKLPFSHMDPPAHTRLRRALVGYFTGRGVEKHRARIEQIVSDRLNVMERLVPPVDLVGTFARPIPSLVTCALFGVPESECDTFEKLSAIRHNTEATVDDLLGANERFREFIGDIIDHKRAKPAADMLGELAHGGELTNEELVSAAVLLVRAAHATTAATIAFSVAALLGNRNRWRALCVESVAGGQLVDELLRFTSVSQCSDLRTALEDVELGGTVIKAFEQIAVSLAAANRDQQVFLDPNNIDMARPSAAKHVAFGHGIHKCLGQHLARLELQIALTGLVRRFPTLELVGPVEDILWYGGERNLYGPQHVRVSWKN